MQPQMKTTNTLLPYLPSEILHKIFYNFVTYTNSNSCCETHTKNDAESNDSNNPTNPKIQNVTSQTFLEVDIASLYSCMLVSKHWSANAVRYLWLQPFHSNLSKTAQQSLVNTYLKCLTDDQRDELTFSGIKFPLSKFPKTHRSTVYAYSAFLKHLNFYKLVAFVGAREQELEEDHYNQMSKMRVVLRTLLRLFVEYGAKIQSLIISTRVGPYPVQDHDDTLATPEAKTLLSNIKELKIEATKYMFSDIFKSLATISCNVKNLDIEWSDMIRHRNSSEMKINWNKLLSAPKNLHAFRLYNSERADIIGPALVHQQHALRTVELEKVDFESCEPLTELASCINLATLQFKDCTHVTSELTEPLVKANFSHLRHLHLSGNNKCQELLDWAKKINRK